MPNDFFPNIKKNFNPSHKSNDVFNYIEYYGLPLKSKFSGTFEKDLYEKTLEEAKKLKIHSDIWPYYELEDDFYIRNSYGYRTDEFDTYADDEFDMMLGCSFVEGIGLRKTEMWVHHYEQLMNTRTVNLSKGGNSNKNIKHTLFSWFSSKRPKPKRIIIAWTEVTRNTYIRSMSAPVHLNYGWRIQEIFDEHDAVINEIFSTRLKSDILYSNDFIEDYYSVNCLAKAWGVNLYNFFSNHHSLTKTEIDILYNHTGFKGYSLNYEIGEGWKADPIPFYPAMDGSHMGFQYQKSLAQQVYDRIQNEEN